MSMTITLVQAAPPPPSSVVVSAPSDSSLVCVADFVPAAERLKKIFHAHKGDTDVLSLDILAWCKDVAKLSKRTRLSDTELLASLQEKVKTLSYSVLVNPLDEKPLKEPVLANDWVWEKSYLTDYRTLSDKSPFPDFAPLPVDAPPHEFAQDMLEWMSSLPQGLRPLQPSNTSVPLPEIPADKVSKLFTYCTLASNAAVRAFCRSEIVQNEETQALVQRAQEDLQRELEVRAKELEETQLKMQQETEQRIDGLEATHRSTEAVQSQRIDDLHNRVQVVSSDCATLQQEVSAQDQEIRSLRGQIAAQWNQIRDLQNEDSGCIIQ